MPGTRFLIPSITLAAALLLGARASDDEPFRALAASEYAHQTVQQVTVGAKAFDSPELTAQAFGKKTDFLKFGVLPVLVVIENKRTDSLDLRQLEISLVASDGRHVAAVSPDELPFLAKNGKRRPSGPGIGGLPVPMPKKKNPLADDSIVARAFVAKMLPPGDSASGFFYFEARPERGDSIYLNGLREARSGKEIMYFEFPLNGKPGGSQ
ncbi:MAG TPA: hypothetical protein VGK64_21755 [Bryobacteraceae bacterium]